MHTALGSGEGDEERQELQEVIIYGDPSHTEPTDGSAVINTPRSLRHVPLLSESLGVRRGRSQRAAHSDSPLTEPLSARHRLEETPPLATRAPTMLAPPVQAEPPSASQFSEEHCCKVEVGRAVHAIPL